MKHILNKKFTDEEKELFLECLTLLRQNHEKTIGQIKMFKWLCHANLPQYGKGYEDNKNVFDIEQKTVNDITTEFLKREEMLLKFINQ